MLNKIIWVISCFPLIWIESKDLSKSPSMMIDHTFSFIFLVALLFQFKAGLTCLEKCLQRFTFSLIFSDYRLFIGNLNIHIIGSTQKMTTISICIRKPNRNWPTWGCISMSPQSGHFWGSLVSSLFSPIALKGTFFGGGGEGLKNNQQLHFWPPPQKKEEKKEVIIIIHLERSEKKNEENKKSIKKVQFFMRFPHSVSFLLLTVSLRLPDRHNRP